MNNVVNGFANPRSFSVGDWIADPSGRTLTRDREVSKITPLSMHVLVYLATRAGQSVTHDELLAAFWRGPISSANAVHKVIAELRHVMGDDSRDAQYFETVPKRGYRLVAPVVFAPLDNDAPNPPSEGHQVASSAPLNPERIENGTASRAQLTARALTVAAAAAISLAFGWWALQRSTHQEAHILMLGHHSAVVLPVRAGSESLRETIDDVPDQVVAHFKLLAGTSVRDSVASDLTAAGTIVSDASTLLPCTSAPMDTT